MCRTQKSAIFLLLFTALFSFFSCNSKKGDFSFSLDDSFYIAKCSEKSTIEDAENCKFEKLTRMGYKNISEITGKKKNFVWLKAEFFVPEELKNQDLSFLIPHLHFAGDLYLNDHFISSSGRIEEPIQDASYKPQLFIFPKHFIKQDGKNTIYIKLLALGRATISNGTIVTTKSQGLIYSDSKTFYQSSFYMLFEGGMFISLLVFALLYLSYKKEKSYLFFSLMNFFSIIFFSNFFMTTLPFIGYKKLLPYFLAFKISRCLSFFGIEFTFVLFVFSFIKRKHRAIETIIRAFCSFACIIQTCFAKDYESLMSLCPVLLLISGIDVALTFFVIIKSTFSKCKQEQQNSKILFIAFTPLFIAFITDAIVKLLLKNIQMIYFSLPGYQIAIIVIFIYFCLQYKKDSVRLEYLNTELENEVMIQTKKLTKMNEEGKITGCIVDGPLSVDMALSHEACVHKNALDRNMFSVKDE